MQSRVIHRLETWDTIDLIGCVVHIETTRPLLRTEELHALYVTFGALAKARRELKHPAQTMRRRLSTWVDARITIHGPFEAHMIGPLQAALQARHIHEAPLRAAASNAFAKRRAAYLAKHREERARQEVERMRELERRAIAAAVHRQERQRLEDEAAAAIVRALNERRTRAGHAPLPLPKRGRV